MNTLLAYLFTTLSFDLTFFNSLDDHAARKYYYHEYHWVLQEGKLMYDMTVRNTRYADTVVLQESQLEKIHLFLKNKALYQNINLEKNNPKSKEFHAYKVQITGKVNIENAAYTYHLRKSIYKEEA